MPQIGKKFDIGRYRFYAKPDGTGVIRDLKIDDEDSVYPPNSSIAMMIHQMAEELGVDYEIQGT